MYRFPDAVILVFCKAPVPGQVKTRLLPALTPQAAVELHCELTELTLEKATDNKLCQVQLWCSPNTDHPYFIGLEQTYKVERKLQQGKDLGERMMNAFAEALSQYKVALVIGCDCPSLTNDDLDQALAHLTQGEPCVLAPAEDGGYVLIGLTQRFDYLFSEIPWGTDKVLDLTQTRLQTNKVSYKLLNTQWDVDTIDDLQRYQIHKKSVNDKTICKKILSLSSPPTWP